jgi:hypothetical protein
MLARPATVPLLAWLGPATVAPSWVRHALLVEGTEFPDTLPAAMLVVPNRDDEPPVSSLP